MRMLCSTLGAAMLAGCAALALPAGAAAEQRPQRLSLVAPLGTHVVDRVLDRPRSLTAAQRSSATPTAAYTTADGQSVDLSFAPGYTPDPVVAQSYVDYLGSLPHGNELSQAACARHAHHRTSSSAAAAATATLACYTASTHTMTVPGQQADSEHRRDHELHHRPRVRPPHRGLPQRTRRSRRSTTARSTGRRTASSATDRSRRSSHPATSARTTCAIPAKHGPTPTRISCSPTSSGSTAACCDPMQRPTRWRERTCSSRGRGR